MLTFLSLVHILIGLGLVGFVLLQDPKGGAAGVFGGGSSSTSFFGASGASNFLTTATKWLAVLFAVSCLVLTAVTSKKPASVMDQVDSSAPAAPAAAAPQQSPLDAAKKAVAPSVDDPKPASPAAPAAAKPEAAPTAPPASPAK